MIEGEYELLDNPIFKIIPMCHAENILKMLLYLLFLGRETAVLFLLV